MNGTAIKHGKTKRVVPVTPWFDGKVKPMRVGVYERRIAENYPEDFAYWNGERWTGMGETLESAYADRKGYTYFQEDQWRGIVKQGSSGKHS